MPQPRIWGRQKAGEERPDLSISARIGGRRVQMILILGSFGRYYAELTCYSLVSLMRTLL